MQLYIIEAGLQEQNLIKSVVMAVVMAACSLPNTSRLFITIQQNHESLQGEHASHNTGVHNYLLRVLDNHSPVLG